MFTTIKRLSPIAPFDFGQSLAFIGEFPPMLGEQNLDAQTLTKALRVQGQTVAFRVSNTGTVDQPQLDCTICAEQPISSDMEVAVFDRVTFFLSLAEDLKPFYALAQTDAPFMAVVKQLYGYHQVKFLTPFENTYWSILTQRTPMPLARQIKQRLVERFGGAIEVEGQRYAAFPEAQDFQPLDPALLQQIVGNERKASYLFSAIQAFSQVDEDFLRHAPYTEVEQWLRSIKGIGEWSATFILIRGLGRMEQALITDPSSLFTKEMTQAAAHVYGPQPFDALQRIAERYGQWQGYWGHYLRAAN